MKGREGKELEKGKGNVKGREGKELEKGKEWKGRREPPSVRFPPP